MPCPGTSQEQEVEKWKKRCELAERALTLMIDVACVGTHFIDEASEELKELLLGWEKARGQRFLYTDGDAHIIALGRATLDWWLAEYGYDTFQDWELVPDNEVIAICVGQDGRPCDLEDDGAQEQPRSLTAAEWLALVKEDGVLCSEPF
jgi:hypothetical protein